MLDEPAPDGAAIAGLVARVARRQDRDAFASLFAHFAPRLKSFFIRQGADASSAEDLSQECMLLVWRRAGEYVPGRAAVSTWLFTIARNLGVDRLRRERRYDPQTPPEDALVASAVTPDAVTERAPEADLLVREREEALHRALATLPEDQRRIVDLHYSHWMSTAEIAQHESLPQGTVKSRMRLALKRLRLTLEEA